MQVNLFGGINNGYYQGCEVNFVEEVNLGKLGKWYLTEDIPNEYTEYNLMWFSEYDIDFEEDGE